MSQQILGRIAAKREIELLRYLIKHKGEKDGIWTSLWDLQDSNAKKDLLEMGLIEQRYPRVADYRISEKGIALLKGV